MKNIPQRTCTVCRKQKNKNELLRIVKNKENTAKIISECNLKENCRAEQLTINDFINLTNSSSAIENKA